MGSSCSSGPKKDKCSKKKKSHEANGGNHSQRGSNASNASVYMIASPPPTGMAGPSSPTTKPPASPIPHEKPKVERVDSQITATVDAVNSPMSPTQLLNRQASREGAGGTGELDVIGRIELSTLKSEIKALLTGSELKRLGPDGKLRKDYEERERDVFERSHRCINVVVSRYHCAESTDEISKLEEIVVTPMRKLCHRKSYELQWLVLEGEKDFRNWNWLCDEHQSPLTFLILITSENPPSPENQVWSSLAENVISNPHFRRKTLVIWKRILQSPHDTTEFQQKLLESMDEARILKCNLKWGDADMKNYFQSLQTHLWSMMAPMIDMVLDINERKDLTALNQPQFLGLSRSLYLELVNQYRLNQSFLKQFGGGLFPSEFLEKIYAYVWGQVETGKNNPLVLHGPSGKSSLVAFLAYKLANNDNAAHLVFRIIAHQQQTRFLSLFNNLIEQCCLLLAQPKPNSMKAADLPALLGRIAPPDIPLVVLLDGLDSIVASSTSTTFEWLPVILPDNVRLIITVNDPSLVMGHFDSLVPPEAFHPIPQVLPEAACDIVKAHLHDKQIILNETQQLVCDGAVRQNPNVSYISMIITSINVFLQCGKPSSSIQFEPSLNTQANALLESLEEQLDPQFIKSALSFVLLSKCGLSQLELASILTQDFAQLPALSLNNSIRSLFSWLDPALLGSTVLQGITLQTINCPHFVSAINQRYFDAEPEAWKEKILSRLKEFWKKQDNMLRKLAESIDEKPISLEPQWYRDMLKYGSVEDLIKTLQQSSVAEVDQEDVDNFVDFLKELYQVLKYDGEQFFTQVHGQISLPNKSSLILKRLLDSCIEDGAPCNSLFCPLGPGMLQIKEDLETIQTHAITIHRIKDNPRFMVSLNEHKNEVVVWDIVEQKPVRTYNGILQPRDIKFIDPYKAVILCNRELCIYDLDAGEFQIKLKGVMNQKMAFYGTHDSQHIVAMARNRMYVNLININSGDCVSTFKAGEDRFLNSLLVAADGSYCVSGDETQKPFPLLVWELCSRKLIYDLRIPHHDFDTSLSAITNDGHYVICVCQEVSDPEPNFVIVYDLQNGTLFKKWRPEASTCSVAISSEGGCAITGLTNTSLIVWDLITGACRFALVGHTAPVTCIQLSDNGQRCLTADFPKWRDPATWLWDLTKGVCLASFVSAQANISSCQLSSDGVYVVFCLSDRETILTLVLVESGSSIHALLPTEKVYYGNIENDGKCVNFNETQK